MRAGVTDSESSENDPGTGPAKSVSPINLANDKKRVDHQPSKPAKTITEDADDIRRLTASEDFDSLHDVDGSEIDIDMIFRRKLRGLRLLPKKERAAARRAARDWLRCALKALREQRAYKRRALIIRRQIVGLQALDRSR